MKLDLHIHSKFSFDSILSPKKIVQRKKGLSGLAITDHNTIRGGLEVHSLREPELLIIIGSEIQTEIGDITGLFLNNEIKSRQSMEVIDEIHDQQGIVVLPHPFRSHKLSTELLRKVDLIESFNARSTIKENLQAQKLASIYRIPTVAGSDAHFSWEIGLGVTIVENAYDIEDLRKALLAGQTKTIGIQSPRYMRSLSRLIRSFKAGDYHKLPLDLLVLSINFIRYHYEKIKGDYGNL